MIRRFLTSYWGWPCHLVLLSTLFGLGCQALPEEKFIRLESHVPRNYHVSLPTSGWRPFEMEGADVAMRHEVSSVAFALFTPSRMKKEVLPLEVLSTQLLMEIKDKQIITKEYLTLGGHPALRTLLEGTVEGVRVKIEAWVLTRGELVYDIIYWGSPEDFQAHYDDFRQVVGSFRFVE